MAGSAVISFCKLEAEHAERTREITEKRRQLPWVAVEKEYQLDTEDGKKTIDELFEGRSQLLAYNVMYGPDYTLGACPGCTSLADSLDGARLHLSHMDITLIAFSRAPIDRLAAYEQRMGWQFPCVSTYETEFAFRLRPRAHARNRRRRFRRSRNSSKNHPSGSQEWSRDIGAELKDGLRENPSWIAFARENGTVYHTYSVSAPDPFVAAVLQLPRRADAKARASRNMAAAEG